MKALTALVCIPIWELQANNSLFTKSLWPTASMLCNQLAWDCACIYIYK